MDMTEERFYMLPIAKWDKKAQTVIIEDEEKIRNKFPYRNREWYPSPKYLKGKYVNSFE